MEFDFWHWFILGLIIMTLEVLLPLSIFLWIGLAGFITGAIVWVFPNITWEGQAIIFAILSVIAVVIWRFYEHKRPIASDEPLLNRRNERYVGRLITLHEPIVDGVGKIKVDDSIWKVVGPDSVAGTKVKVVAADNVLLHVEPV